MIQINTTFTLVLILEFALSSFIFSWALIYCVPKGTRHLGTQSSTSKDVVPLGQNRKPKQHPHHRRRGFSPLRHCRVTDREQHLNVLHVEAGPDYGGVSEHNIPPAARNSRKVPMEGRSETFYRLINWSPNVTVPDGSLIGVPQAKIIGGGSSVNGGTALRSVQNDSKEWVELVGDAWGYDSVKETYQSLEDDERRGEDLRAHIRLLESRRVRPARFKRPS